MAVSFVRIDDRMIHGQTVTRWAVEYPCDGIIAVNDAAASNPVLKSAYKSLYREGNLVSDAAREIEALYAECDAETLEHVKHFHDFVVNSERGVIR